MTELLRQFFSFDKMMKDRLVAAFFFLGLVVITLGFLSTLLAAFGMMGHDFFDGLGKLLWAFVNIIFLFVGLRLACELMIAVFHINDNLSPDGGKSETAELDPVEAAREAATKAAKSASSATKTIVEKTKSRFAEDDDDAEDVYPDYEDPTPPKKPRRKAPAKKPTTKTTATKTTAKKTTATKKPATQKPTAKKPAAKKAPAKKPAAKK